MKATLQFAFTVVTSCSNISWKQTPQSTKASQLLLMINHLQSPLRKQEGEDRGAANRRPLARIHATLLLLKTNTRRHTHTHTHTHTQIYTHRHIDRHSRTQAQTNIHIRTSTFYLGICRILNFDMLSGEGQIIYFQLNLSCSHSKKVKIACNRR